MYFTMRWRVAAYVAGGRECLLRGFRFLDNIEIISQLFIAERYMLFINCICYVNMRLCSESRMQQFLRTAIYHSEPKIGANSLRWISIVCKQCNMWLIWGHVLQVHVHQQIGIDINNAEVHDFLAKPYVINPGNADLPLQWFECHPVVSKRLTIMIIQIESESCVSVIWTGDVWAYRGALLTAGVTSAHVLTRQLRYFYTFEFFLAHCNRCIHGTHRGRQANRYQI